MQNNLKKQNGFLNDHCVCVSLFKKQELFQLQTAVEFRTQQRYTERLNATHTLNGVDAWYQTQVAVCLVWNTIKHIVFIVP